MPLERNKRIGILAAGIIGDPRLASWLLDAMESAPLARPAGAAFCLMTGCDLRRDDLDAERPPAPAALEDPAPSASESDAADQQARPPIVSLVDEADDDLAWPDTVRLREWWNEKRHVFVTGIRYLAATPIRRSELSTVLRTGNQRQRAAAAMELALLNPGAPMVDVTAPAHRQTGASDGFI